MARMSPPIVPEQPVRVLTDDELRRLFKACDGTEFDQRRDNAILRLFAETGIRRAELAGLTPDDIDLRERYVRVLGKGRRQRFVGFGASTAQAVDRYLRVRARHRCASLPAMWIGHFGAMTGRCEIGGFYEQLLTL